MLFDQNSGSSSRSSWGDESSGGGSSSNTSIMEDEAMNLFGAENWDDHVRLDDITSGISAIGCIRIHSPIPNFPGENQFPERAPPFQSIDTTLGNGQCDCERFGINPCCLQDPEFDFFSPDINIEEEMAKERTEISNPNNLKRKRLNGIVFHKVDPGTLSQRERFELPSCAVAKIRQFFPEESGFYIGFKAN